MTIDVRFKANWVHAGRFEDALQAAGNPLAEPDMSVRFVFPTGSKVMVDGGIRLLSLINQLDSIGKRVSLDFEEGTEGAWGYLDRMGFLKQLPRSVSVTPPRPPVSAVDRYGGTSDALVEFEPIRIGAPDRALPGRLERVLLTHVGDRNDRDALGEAAFTVFSELIGNVYEHSETELAGYAVQQVYRGGGRATVAVSDSGRGLVDTLRQSRASLPSRLANGTDTDLVVEAFRNGLSRCGAPRGAGLKACADHAIRYRAKLWVRLATSQVHLKPSRDGYSANMAYTREGLPLLWGTHISFAFELTG